MELLLNLVWLLLALPAYWLWRRDAEEGPTHRASSLQCLMALACALVLLFPVISASDDLHTMRAEMEESAASKRTARQAASDKTSIWVNRLQGSAALAPRPTWLPVPEVGKPEGSAVFLWTPARPCAFHVGRAPPHYSLLG